jgi:hypothetical protein
MAVKKFRNRKYSIETLSYNERLVARFWYLRKMALSFSWDKCGDKRKIYFWEAEWQTQLSMWTSSTDRLFARTTDECHPLRIFAESLTSDPGRPCSLKGRA